MSASQPWEAQFAPAFTWEISTFILEFLELEIKSDENLIWELLSFTDFSTPLAF